MRFRIFFSIFLLSLTACASSIPEIANPTEPKPGYEPKGYTQFCNDFPESLLCEQKQ